MLFNSIEFLIFFPLVFSIYWIIDGKGIRIQNFFLILASYFFYGWWDWRFLGLIILSSTVDYTIGRNLSKQNDPTKRKIQLILSILVNIGILGYFKYYNFFIDSFIQSFSFFGKSIELSSIKIILPIGISFYTFQTMSYTIDVFNGKLKATKDVISFFAYVSFFPQLVAGPIERATNLLPQFYKKRQFDYNKSVDGLRQILWGFFKKVIIADTCAIAVNQIFQNYTEQTSSTLILGVILFAFQIYCDFSGYSDIAIGTARLFGFDLMRNFAYPYFSRDIAEFWRRWHISLSTWFRDYLYIPLGGSKGGISMKIRNTFIIFIVSGFWHGANWTFIFWGFLNALFFLPLLLLHRNRKNIEFEQSRLWPSPKKLFNIVLTFSLTCIAWIFFRSPTMSDAFSYIGHIFNNANIFPVAYINYKLFLFIITLMIVEWVQKNNPHGLYLTGVKSKYLRWAAYYLIIFIIIYFIPGEKQNFIYFQF